LVALTIVEEQDEIMLVTANGVVTRIKAGDISRQGRPATGVKAQNLQGNDLVMSVNKIINPEDESTDAQVDSAEDTATEALDVAQTSLLDNNEN
jgi:DNA gyrase subunit A